jgi:hypothetical protein
MQYDDVSTGPLFNNPTAPTIYCEDANGRYWSTPHPPTTLAHLPWISDTWMSIHFKTYGAKYAGAVVWESPVPGTYRLDADLVYTGGVGTVSFGVFYHDADTDSYFQVQKGFLFKSDSYGWTPVTSAVAQASVSLDAGDRLVFLQRTHACHPNNGSDWVYTSGPTLYAVRRCEQRNLTVTLLTTGAFPICVPKIGVADVHFFWHDSCSHITAIGKAQNASEDGDGIEGGTRSAGAGPARKHQQAMERVRQAGVPVQGSEAPPSARAVLPVEFHRGRAKLDLVSETG